MSAEDIVLILGALGTFITILVGAAIAIWNKMEEVKHLVNGVAEGLKIKAKDLSNAEVEIASLKGVQTGIEIERAAPKIDATIVNETVLTKEKELTEAKKVELKKKAKPAKPGLKR